MTTHRLIVFLKQPVLGKVKTRLAKTVGDTEALRIYKKLVDRTLREMDNGLWSLTLHWAYHQETPSELASYPHVFQQGAHLGARMQHSIAHEMKNFDHVVLIGADIPTITKEIVQKAFELLTTNDLVFGPAKDGGYYLVGMRKPCFEVFENDYWSHPDVLGNALSVAKTKGYSVGLVNQLRDLDDASDLEYFPHLKS